MSMTTFRSHCENSNVSFLFLPNLAIESRNRSWEHFCSRQSLPFCSSAGRLQVEYAPILEMSSTHRDAMAHEIRPQNRPVATISDLNMVILY
uniref:Uncharacterized protein n=1 Tax=Strigamia maritima TaxID=126957 RepID=T1JIV0_STRMM